MISTTHYNLRIPDDVSGEIERRRKSGGTITSVIVSTLRHAWHIPEPAPEPTHRVTLNDNEMRILREWREGGKQ